MGTAASWRHQVVDYLGLERNVAAASAAIFLLGLGEELWKKFLPKYMESLGAGPGVIGLFGTAEDFFDAVYQYPGGWLADRLGRRRAFLIFIAVASVGYLIYLLSPSWPFIFAGLAFAMAWHSMASPAIFAVIGDALPKERRAIGFTFQSMLKRVPMVISPVIGGALIASLGIQSGMRIGLGITLVLASATALIVLVDLAAANLRARTVGLYYLVRSLTITPAAAIGGLLWKLAPQTPFIAAGIIGLVGTLVFAMTVEERYAS